MSAHADAWDVAYDVDKKPAEWLRAKAQAHRRRFHIVGASVGLLVCLALFTGLGLRSTALTLPILLVMLLLYRAFDEMAPNARRWAAGARAENAVGEVLNQLRDRGYVVMHDIEQQYEGNVDHLVSGPTGVYMIETKSRTYLREHLRKAKRQSAKLHDRLGVWVTPVICLNDGRDGRPWRDSGVWIVPREAIIAWISIQKNPKLDFERLAQFADDL